MRIGIRCLAVALAAWMLLCAGPHAAFAQSAQPVSVVTESAAFSIPQANWADGAGDFGTNGRWNRSADVVAESNRLQGSEELPDAPEPRLEVRASAQVSAQAGEQPAQQTRPTNSPSSAIPASPSSAISASPATGASPGIQASPRIQASSAAQTVAGADKAEKAKQEPHCTQKPCPLKTEAIDWYKRFMNGPEVKPLTPREKLHLAAKNIIDPFNALTILAQSSFFVGFNSHSAYGPGMPGFGRNVGVSYAQDMTSQFFNVFLIPSIAHQDPHYHRMPGASYKRRFLHATAQVFWTLGDNGKGMVNYANLVGSGVDIAIGNLYVPGQQTHLTAALSEYFVGLATDPVDNYVTEFLPDIARRIHIHVVIVQDILNQISRTSPPTD